MSVSTREMVKARCHADVWIVCSTSVMCVCVSPLVLFSSKPFFLHVYCASCMCSLKTTQKQVFVVLYIFLSCYFVSLEFFIDLDFAIVLSFFFIFVLHFLIFTFLFFTLFHFSLFGIFIFSFSTSVSIVFLHVLFFFLWKKRIKFKFSFSEQRKYVFRKNKIIFLKKWKKLKWFVCVVCVLVCVLLLVCVCALHVCAMLKKWNWRNHMPWIVFLSRSRIARQCLMMRTDTTLDQDWGTEDNMCEFQHSSSHVDCNFDARLVSKSGRIHETETARLHTVSCPNNSMHRGVYNHSLVLKKRLLSLSSRIYGL